jgi:hypothetical protein
VIYSAKNEKSDAAGNEDRPGAIHEDGLRGDVGVTSACLRRLKKKVFYK